MKIMFASIVVYAILFVAGCPPTTGKADTGPLAPSKVAEKEVQPQNEKADKRPGEVDGKAIEYIKSNLPIYFNQTYPQNGNVRVHFLEPLEFAKTKEGCIVSGMLLTHRVNMRSNQRETFELELIEHNTVKGRVFEIVKIQLADYPPP